METIDIIKVNKKKNRSKKEEAQLIPLIRFQLRHAVMVRQSD